MTALPIVLPSPPPEPVVTHSQPEWLAWMITTLLAGFVALASAAVLDPRPRALHELGNTLVRLANDNQP
jgi:hypothetical protein